MATKRKTTTRIVVPKAHYMVSYRLSRKGKAWDVPFSQKRKAEAFLDKCRKRPGLHGLSMRDHDWKERIQ